MYICVNLFFEIHPYPLYIEYGSLDNRKAIFNGSVAQLARASDSYSLGPGFKSLHCHQSLGALSNQGAFFVFGPLGCSCASLIHF